MKFSVVIHAAPYSAQAAHSALRFSREVLAQGHEIYRLFFFGDGVHNASRLAVVPQDEASLQADWEDLITEHKLDSVVCVTSALRRGILNATEAKRHELDAVSIRHSSEIAGLGQLIDAVTHSDRVVNFG